MRVTDTMAVLLFVSSLALPAGGQPADVLVRETIDVKEVVVDAVVTDKTDTPIADLEPDDFQLEVDGKKARVVSLLSGRDLRESVSGRVTIVVLFDERHLQDAHRRALLPQISEALRVEMSQHPTWVAVVALRDQLESLLPPTRDAGSLVSALAAAGERPLEASPLQELQRRATYGIRDLLQGLAATGSEYRFAARQTQAVLGEVIDYGRQLSRDTRLTLAGVASLVDALSFLPGRKVVLLVSDGLASRPLGVVSKTVLDRLAGASRLYDGDEITAPGSNQYVNDPDRRPTGGNRADFAGVRVSQGDDGGALQFQAAVAAFDCSLDFERLGALANTHRVTFYPVKPPVTDSAFIGLGARQGERGSVTVLSDMRAGLEQLAETTGGLAFDSETGVEHFLRQINEDYAAYYALSFRPPDAMEQSGIRELVLRVRRKKSRIRYRASYMPIDLQESLSSQAWGTLLFGWQENVHGLEVAMHINGSVGQDYDVEVLFSLPIGKLELVPLGETAAGAYRVVMQLAGEDGVRLEPAHVGFEVRVPVAELEQAREQLFGVRTQLRLPPGRYDMAIGLWEENTGKTTFVIEPVQVGTAGESDA